ncbi:hypothetical protein [Verminephrobacter eiseniae]|uniref:Transmembrane protein n=1 Tax=Verminephrobacter eiseniae (strain EF01-2) TaxID=391735 RepID=A1WKY5_VEREI|nr:hypothetical protein [Verminephrobacter eiseniae]ABM58292.1 hypothetical protein Veis_2547 [Verminephrobacter eiseniae EF01-2]MCW5283877.1 hypothetical protein [Verminephrobacter eiseniae]MCW5301586.1 hypothetical protein [Verminephrobacter eiseniae]MCW8179587.1 hypothetical protein [Verminephrobacter eiseniae]MCW8189860.1 hypothetical protein [Verminephrobacter eiseniae]
MLTSFGRYRLSYAVSLFLAISILGALLMFGFARNAGYTQTDLTFAMTMIICGVTYATVRDAAGAFAYAVESSKFYRDEADFALLKSYACGWRRVAALLARPMPSTLLIAASFLGLQFLATRRLAADSEPNLQAAVLFVAVLFPFALSLLVHFLSPVFVGWKDLDMRKMPPMPQGEGSVAKLMRKIAVADLLITMLINVALVMPVRHNPDFHPSLGYGSVEFVAAALILAMIVGTLSLLSAWRTRVYACSGDLYRLRAIDLTWTPLSQVTGNRWVRWVRYSLLIGGFTIVACLLLGALYETAPIQIVLVLLLLPVAIMFRVERNAVLTSNFRDASQLVAEFPARMPISERIDLVRP